jgi:hypothetical protein
MKIKKKDGGPERRILTGMIVNDSVVGRISDKWEKGLFKSKWSNIVGNWCVQYFNKYDSAPGANIQRLFESWADKEKDQDTIDLVEDFLSSLSGEYEHHEQSINADYIIDEAGKYFQETRLRRTAEKVLGFLDQGEVSEAQTLIDTTAPIQLGPGTGIDVLSDMEAVKSAVLSKSQPLIEYHGALGNFFGDALERDALIAFEAPEKRAKTFWLMDVAWRAMFQGKRVAFFQVGDLSQDQIMRRFIVRASRRPFYATKGNQDESLNHPVKIPVEIEMLSDAKVANVTYKRKNFDKPLTWKEGWRSLKEIAEKLPGRDSLLRLDTYPANTITVPGILSTLRTWEQQRGWTPDVVVIDYADLILPVNTKDDKRDQINDVWIRLRSMAQTLHCLVVTATQAKADSYNAYLLNRSHFSEDKRKNAHVNGMIGINQTPEEKEKQIIRLNWLLLREREYDERRCCHTAGCLALANPAMVSTF